MLKNFLMATLLISSLACGENNTRYSVDESIGDRGAAEVVGHSLVDYSWAGEVQLWSHKAMSAESVEGLLAAIETWNEAIGSDTLIYLGETTTGREQGLYSSLDDEKTVVYLESQWSSSTGKPLETLGTTVWEVSENDESQIVKGDIILNGEHYFFDDAEQEPDSDEDLASGGLVDAETVLLHELGHLLGLRHVSAAEDPHSIMSPYTEIGYGDFHRALSEKDSAVIRQLYR